LAATNRPSAVHSPERLKQVIPKSLMIPFAMIVGHELGYRAPKMLLPQRNDAIEALVMRKKSRRDRLKVVFMVEAAQDRFRGDMKSQASTARQPSPTDRDNRLAIRFHIWTLVKPASDAASTTPLPPRITPSSFHDNRPRCPNLLQRIPTSR
jgi:hypothetical protein